MITMILFPLQQMAEHPLFAPYLQEEGAVEGEAPINPLSEGLAQLKFDPDHSSPQGCFVICPCMHLL